MLLSYRGSVNRWECDENDHLNVRFCEQKLWQTLAGGLLQSGLVQENQIDDLPLRLTGQHLRFQQESRIATPISGYFSVISVADHGFNVLAQLRHTVSGEPLCTSLAKVDGIQGAYNEDSGQHDVSHALPRGIRHDFEYHTLDLDGALAKGFVETGRGVIQRDECSASGELLPHNYMARTSDSMPNLWTHLAGDERVSEQEGGAVVEFRRRYHKPLRVNQPFVVASGLLDAQGKIQRFGHLLFNAETGMCCASAQAVAVRMDLQARKAIDLSPKDLAALLDKRVQPL